MVVEGVEEVSTGLRSPAHVLDRSYRMTAKSTTPESSLRRLWNRDFMDKPIRHGAVQPPRGTELEHATSLELREAIECTFHSKGLSCLDASVDEMSHAQSRGMVEEVGVIRAQSR